MSSNFHQLLLLISYWVLMPNYNEIWSDKGLIFLLKLLVFASNVASKPLKEGFGFWLLVFYANLKFFCCQFELVWYNEYYHDRRICLISVQQIYIFSCIQCQYGVCKEKHNNGLPRRPPLYACARSQGNLKKIGSSK